MTLASVIIDGVEVKVKEGQKLLWAALDNGFYIPNLCAIRQADPPLASCRLCFVEIEGRRDPVTSCTESITDGMVVHLNTPRVKRIRNTAFELLLSHHRIDCRNCSKNKNCGLQDVASKIGLKLKLQRLKQIPHEFEIDASHPLFNYDPSKCILCKKCVWVCHQQGSGILDFAFRGIQTRVSTIGGIPLAEAGCNDCLACVAVCPVGALTAKPGVSIEEAKTLIAASV